MTSFLWSHQTKYSSAKLLLYLKSFAYFPLCCSVILLLLAVFRVDMEKVGSFPFSSYFFLYLSFAAHTNPPNAFNLSFKIMYFDQIR